MNRFKELDLVDRVHEQLWMEVHNIVWEAVTKTTPKKYCKYYDTKEIQILVGEEQQISIVSFYSSFPQPYLILVQSKGI